VVVKKKIHKNNEKFESIKQKRKSNRKNLESIFFKKRIMKCILFLTTFYLACCRLPFQRSRPSPDNLFAKGVFRPVQQEIQIRLPYTPLFSNLKGKCFLQIGSNPRYFNKPGYHWFDGDGMVHAVFFNETEIVYTNHWIRTERFLTETKYKKSKYFYFGELVGGHGFYKIIKELVQKQWGWISKHRGTANTAFLAWNQSVYALHEGDLPYKINIKREKSRISTDKKWDLPLYSVSAHPKQDKQYLYLYGYNNKDFSYGMFYHNMLDKNGTIVLQQNISLINNGLIHDIGQTETFLIIPDLPLKYDVKHIFNKRLPLQFDKRGISRFGVLAKNGSSLDWYTLDTNIFLFHIGHVLETADAFLVYACVMDDIHLMDFVHLENPENKIRGNARLQEIRLDKKTKTGSLVKNQMIENMGKVSRDDYNLDFPFLSLQKSWFSNRIKLYTCIFDATNGKIVGLTKIEIGTQFQTAKPDVFFFPNGEYMTGEPQVVQIHGKEYILCFLYSYSETWLSLVDMDKQKIYKMALRTRVPPGFHSLLI